MELLLIFDPKVHTYSQPFDGDPREALELARAALLAQGFEVVSESESEMHASGPGMQSTQQSPLVGISEVRFSVGPSTLAATATLGAVAKMTTFLYLFPPALALVLAVILAFAGMAGWWFSLLWVAPWIVIAPFMATALERRTTNAVDGLVRSMARASKRR